MSKKTKDINLYYAYKLEPQEAVNYLRNKGYQITNDWREMLEEAHAKAFTIAKMTDAELLKDTKNMLETALTEGWSSQKTQRELTNMFKARGWWGKQTIEDENGEEKTIQLGSPYRVRTIYRQNIQSAYNAGRYLKQLKNVDFAPYFQYICVLDEATRAEHRALHGKVLRYDDPFWEHFYPPNGWGCRCIVKSLTEKAIARKKLDIEKSSVEKSSSEDNNNELDITDVIVNQNTGETKEVALFRTKDMLGNKITVQTNAGWSSNTGKFAWDIDVLAYKSIKQLPEETRDFFISEMAQNLHNKKVIENLINETLARGMKSYGLERTLTWFTPKIINALENENIRLKSPIAVFQDRQVNHSLGNRKVERQRLTEQQFKNIYEYVKNPDEIYIDTKEHAVLFIKYLPKEEIINNRDCIKIPVIINSTKTKSHINYVGTTARVPSKDIKNDKRYKKIE